MWQVREFMQCLNYCIEWVGDVDYECFRCVVVDVFVYGFYDFQVDVQKVVMGYVWFMWYFCGYDVDVCVCDVGIILGVFQFCVKIFRRVRFCDVESFVFWGVFSDVEQNNVVKFFECCEVGKCVVDLICVDEGNFGLSYWKFFSVVEIGVCLSVKWFLCKGFVLQCGGVIEIQQGEVGVYILVCKGFCYFFEV